VKRDLEHAFRKALAGEVLFDTYTRHIYATDASLYTVHPLGVAFPRDADDIVAALGVAAEFGVPILPRGAGTSLAGQTVAEAVVLDMSRHMRRLVALDPDAKRARVQPGVIQDELNRAAAKHRLLFAPDTSTSNRATLGGMIGNNSCGARSARYGMTIDHVESLDVLLSDGSRTRLGPVDASQLAARGKGDTLAARLYRDVPRLVAQHERAIREDFPAFWRKSGGYRLERMLPERGPFSLANLVVGSEGTLAIVVEADVRLVEQPKAVVGVAGHFETVAQAIEAAEDGRECDAAVIELVDRFILNLARRSAAHGKLVSVLEGDPGALLWLEFYGDTPAEALGAAERLEEMWRRHGHGYAVLRAQSADQLTRFRELRKAGLGLLSAAGERGERSVAFIEDTAVDPTRLGAYTARLAELLRRHGLVAGFYGHASGGCLHIRPFMDLTRPGAVKTLRAVADEVCALVTEFGGMNSSEHGDGLVRSEFNRRIFGDELYGAMQAIKHLFDPHGRLNPGKKVDAPRMTENLREPLLPRALPVATSFAFEGGMRNAANRCARIGACRKSEVAGRTMCPSFMVTRDERHSTRGRANALVQALSAPDPHAALGDDGLYDVLDLCLECKACKTECPLSVDMAALKAEFLAHYHQHHGIPVRSRLFGHVRTLNQVGAALAPVSNWIAGSRPVRALTERFGGIDRRRSLPRFARQTLQEWFASRSPLSPGAGVRSRGHVVFLADSFTSYTEPEIGRASIELLELAGWDVQLAGDVCCGRALISKGLLKEARERHAHLIGRLGPAAKEGIPIVGCEPSCVFTLKDELPSLSAGDSAAQAIAGQARMVDDLLADAIREGSLRVAPNDEERRPVVFHGHCHQKAAGATAGSVALLQRLPGADVDVLDAGCCGMAGSFGFEREHYDLSLQIGGMRLFPAVNATPADTQIAATGVSCRQQIAQGTGRRAVHPVVLLHSAISRGQTP
jgi:FAD/FMN-containing dehydrogenase/Fe-S oxidoreductase